MQLCPAPWSDSVFPSGSRQRDPSPPAQTVSFFPGAPAGAFSVQAEDSVTHLRGSSSATLAESASQVQINVQLQPLATLAGTVFRPDGKTPATNVAVQLEGAVNVATDTDSAGKVSFRDLPLGPYVLSARS